MLCIVSVILSLVGWYVFHSTILLSAGLVLYLFARVLHWASLGSEEKFRTAVLMLANALRSLVVGGIGCVIGLFMHAHPWYIYGLLAISFYHGAVLVYIYLIAGFIRIITKNS